MNDASSPSILGLAVPDFSLPATSGQTFRLAALRGQPVVIYFYPKDSTPGCTTEAGQFRDLHAAFVNAGGSVWGISRDSLKSHEGFRAKHALPFELISDPDEALCELFDVMKMKNMYGRQVRGVERSTFVIGADGTLAREWRGVKVPGHADEVLDFVRSI